MIKNHEVESFKQVDLKFRPNVLVRHGHLQTIISSARDCQAPRLTRAEQMMILEVEDGVRLKGYYSPQRQGRSKGLVLLLHGWLGCSEAPYVLAMGEHLYAACGYDVFRLNFRDHGETQYLNSGIFRGDQIDEVFEATRKVASLAGGSPLHIVGFSLGGNFAMRLAWKHSQSPVPNLRHTIGICPALDPCHTAERLDKSWLYREYFRRRWSEAFQIKQNIFPELYDFSKELAASTCVSMTECFVEKYCPQESAEAYFEAYTVTPEMMRQLISPVTLLAAADDPVVPPADFDAFRDISPWLQVRMQPHGGHVGFVDVFPFRYWANEFVEAVLETQ